jgi:hypothetical protein
MTEIIPNRTQNRRIRRNETRSFYVHENEFNGNDSSGCCNCKTVIDVLQYILNFYAIVIITLMVLIGSIIFLFLPVTQLIMQYVYNQTSCTSFISPKTWLIVDGVMHIITIIIFLLILKNFKMYETQILETGQRDNKNFMHVFVFVLFRLYYFLLMCEYAWIFTGAVMFARDCKYYINEQINVLMWINLIGNPFVSILTLCVFIKL